MSRLVREEKCLKCNQGWVDIDFGSPDICSTCHGTGIVNTPLTNEEVRETLAEVVELWNSVVESAHGSWGFLSSMNKALDGIKVVE